MGATEGDVIARGFGHLLFSQVSSRLVTFLLNVLVVRRLPPDVYGVAVIQYHLITTTILTFAREGVRRACLRGVQLGEKRGPDLKSIVPLSWLCVPQGLAWSLIVCSTVLAFSGDGVGVRDGSYRVGVLLHGAAAVIETLSEPAYITSTCLLVFKLQLTVETVASLARCFATLIFLRPSLGVPPLVAFGLAAVVYSTTTTLGYWAYFVSRGEAKGMARWEHVTLRSAKRADPELASAYRSFTLQAIEKHVLGEGEKFAMAAFRPTYDQGVYGLVNNLGSVVVRTCLQPFEQAIFTAFSMSSAARRGSGRQVQADLLATVLRLAVLFALIALAFGPSHSFAVLWASYGSGWAQTEAPRILSVYCAYIGSMALNGVAEAFMHATADAGALRGINYSLVAFSALHSVTSVILVRSSGTSGLVAAGCVSMLLRVGYCTWYARGYFREASFPLSSVLPTPLGLASLAACAALSRASERYQLPDPGAAALRDVVGHLGLGCLVGMGLLGVLYKTERKLVSSLADLRRTAKKAD